MSRLERLPMSFSLQFGDGLNSNSHPGVISCYIASLQSLSSRLVARAENEILAFLFEPSTGSVSCCIDIWSKSGGSFGQSWPVEGITRSRHTFLWISGHLPATGLCQCHASISIPLSSISLATGAQWAKEHFAMLRAHTLGLKTPETLKLSTAFFNFNQFTIAHQMGRFLQSSNQHCSRLFVASRLAVRWMLSWQDLEKTLTQIQRQRIWRKDSKGSMGQWKTSAKNLGRPKAHRNKTLNIQACFRSTDFLAIPSQDLQMSCTSPETSTSSAGAAASPWLL